jgi:hypothetical protein
MVAEPTLLLSESPQSPGSVPTRAGFGDRYRYFRGASGTRYLFTLISREELADFRSAVLLLARREGGCLRAISATALDENGRSVDGKSWPRLVSPDCRLLVHLLAEGEEDRRQVVTDLTAAALPALS